MSTVDLTESLKSTGRRYLPDSLQLGVLPWRHIQTLIVRGRILSQTIHSNEVLKGIWDIHSMHSEEVADSTYALDSTSLQFGNMALLNTYMLLSAMWHQVSHTFITHEVPLLINAKDVWPARWRLGGGDACTSEGYHSLPIRSRG